MKKSAGMRILDGLEWAGNKLPDPVLLFLYMSGIIILVSALANAAGLATVNPATGAPIVVQNLLAEENLRRLFSEMPATFTGFAPLGTVLVAMLGVGLAERTGLIGAALGGLVRSVPPSLLTIAVVFAGIMSSLAVDAGYVVLVPLAAAIYYNAGRHPIAGLAAGFAGVSGGFSANLLVTPLDALLAGITQTAAQSMQPGIEVLASSNYYMMAALVPLFTILGALIADRVVEPRLGRYTGTPDGSATPHDPTPEERRGLRNAGIAGLIFLLFVLLLVLPENAILRDETLKDPLTPFYRSIVGLVAIGFLVLGITYGVAIGKIRSAKDAVKVMSQSMSELGYYIVLVFFIAHFIALFNWSQLGAYSAVVGADGLKAAGIIGPVLVVGFILLTATINMMIGSASAKWTLLAPIFVPIFMQLGYTPEFSQAVYRIGDSVTNIISPLNTYFGLIIVFASKYMKDFGIGSLVSTMVPFCVAYTIGGILLAVVWYIMGLPLGPGEAGIYLPG